MQTPERPAFSRRVAPGDQRRTEPQRHHPLAHAGRTMEQICLGDLAGPQRTAEEPQRRLVPEYTLEPVAPFFSHLSHEYIAARATYPPPPRRDLGPGARRRGLRSSRARDARAPRIPPRHAA